MYNNDITIQFIENIISSIVYVGEKGPRKDWSRVYGATMFVRYTQCVLYAYPRPGIVIPLSNV